MLKTYDQNLHTHGLICDGKDAYEDMVQRALELGFDSLGFSGHSFTPYSNSGHCMTMEGTEEYKREIARLKEKYAGQIDIFCGIEFDMYSPDDPNAYDYVLGSLHYLRVGDQYVGIDRSGDQVQQIIDTWFGGDGMKFARHYYREITELYEYSHCDIVAHMDLVAKHNDSRGYFDTSSKEYRGYVAEAIDALAGKVTAFEINTGGIPRGYRSTPYPEPFILKELNRRGCHIVISSDCHDKRYLDYQFGECLELARECGFKEVLKLTKNGFIACPL